MFLNQQCAFAPWEFNDSFVSVQYQWCYRHEMSDETQVWLYGA